MPLGGQQHRHCTRCRAQDDVVNVPAFRDAEEGAGPGHHTRSRRNFDVGQADAWSDPPRSSATFALQLQDRHSPPPRQFCAARKYSRTPRFCAAARQDPLPSRLRACLRYVRAGQNSRDTQTCPMTLQLSPSAQHAEARERGRSGPGILRSRGSF